MPHYKLLVFTNAANDRHSEFNEWYDAIHIPEVREVPGFSGAQRFRIPDSENGVAPEHRYLAIYDMTTDDPQAAIAELRRRRLSGEFQMSDTLASEVKFLLVSCLE